MNKTEFSRYNDGVVFVYRGNGKRSNFGAKENVSELDELELVARLDFEESSKREQDISFAAQNDFSLTLKIRTRYRPDINNKCKAVIDGYLYDVSHVDKNRTEMWLYLTGIKELKK